MAENTNTSAPKTAYPRVTIEFCTQCKWLLRAAYFAQELLSTFSTSLGEVALKPATGGVFVVEIHHQDAEVGVKTTTLWDRKTDGGFPETKELKRRVRDVIEPGRDLGHVDGHKAKKPEEAVTPKKAEVAVGGTCGKTGEAVGEVCEDCK
ncbi:seleno protein domain protein [Geopyxis carbonaria]|nr:seleno protein domain protein [Geopyxis carbonaria]